MDWFRDRDHDREQKANTQALTSKRLSWENEIAQNARVALPKRRQWAKVRRAVIVSNARFMPVNRGARSGLDSCPKLLNSPSTCRNAIEPGDLEAFGGQRTIFSFARDWKPMATAGVDGTLGLAR
jgi:hypothetical protein